MKNNIIITSICTIALFILANSCCKDKPPVVVTKDPCTFSNDYVTTEFPYSESGANVIPAFLNLAPSGLYIDSIFGQKVPSTVEDQVSEKGKYKTCQVSYINVTQLRMVIDAPANQNLDFIDSLNLYIMKKDGSSKVLVGKKGSIPLGTKSLIMDIIPNVDIKNYVIADSFQFRVGARKSAYPVANTTDSTYLRFDANFKGKIFTN